jgi:hypothetical protein
MGSGRQAQTTLDTPGPAFGALDAFVAEHQGFEVMVAFLAGVFV